MDYEKKYKEALERAKEWEGNPAAVEYIFPELTESKDEKIRKFLIDFIKACKWTEKKDQEWPLREDVISWLEKQGKIVEDYEDRLDRCACTNFNKGYKEAMEKQGGQEHSSYSSLEVTDTVRKALQENEDYASYRRDVYAARVGATVEKLILEKQKPVEWGEEDETLFRSCIGAVHAADYYTLDDKEDIENWLKSLKERIKQ